jgi:hypothetical protein
MMYSLHDLRYSLTTPGGRHRLRSLAQTVVEQAPRPRTAVIARNAPAGPAAVSSEDAPCSVEFCLLSRPP